MQLYVSDFLGDTLHLSTEQVGAYLLMLMAMWNAGGVLPRDDAKLARVARVSLKKWRSISDDLMPYFELGEDCISHKRLSKELQKSRDKSELRASAGAAGGRAKALKDKGMNSANASVLPQHSPEARSHIPEGIPPISPKGDVEEAVEIYTEMAKRTGLPEPRKVTQARKRKIGAVLNEYSLDLWREAVSAIEASSFCRGNNDRGWQANIDFLLQRKSFDGLIEGKYADRKGSAPTRRQTAADVLFNLAERMDNAEHSEDDRKAIGFVPSIVNGRA